MLAVDCIVACEPHECTVEFGSGDYMRFQGKCTMCSILQGPHQGRGAHWTFGCQRRSRCLGDVRVNVGWYGLEAHSGHACKWKLLHRNACSYPLEQERVASLLKKVGTVMFGSSGGQCGLKGEKAVPGG
eukprot:jgi/Botrbrau1/15106/Bobra.0240s0007.1